MEWQRAQEKIPNIVREMQIKTVVKFHYSPTRIAKIKKTDNTQCQQPHGATGMLTYHWQRGNTVKPSEKVRKRLVKLNTHFPFYSENLLLDVHPREMRISVHTDLPMNVCSSFIHNPKPDTQTSITSG